MKGSETTREESLSPEIVEPLLRGGWGKPYIYSESCESSQKLLTPDLEEGALSACEEQTSGRGRLGRTWAAPPRTAILCSVLLQPPADRHPPELSLMGGIATALVVEGALGLSSQIKWPNDIMVNRGKVAGVLAEQVGDTVILGVGLNVNQRREELPQDASTPPASLFTVDAVRRERAPLLAYLVLELERSYKLWSAGGIDALYEELGPRDFLRNRRISVDGAQGLAIAIDRRGRLEVNLGGEHRLIESGEVLYDR